MTRRWRARWLVGLVGALVVTQGCSSNRAEPPVPPIDSAKNARGQAPCGLLSAELLAGLQLAAPGTASQASEGPRCEWRGSGGVRLSVTLYTNGGGLGTLAANSEPSTTRVRIAGYPALETFTSRGEFCQYDVGVAADQVVTMAAEHLAPDSCTALHGVLPSVLSNLPAASGAS